MVAVAQACLKADLQNKNRPIRSVLVFMMWCSIEFVVVWKTKTFKAFFSCFGNFQRHRSTIHAYSNPFNSELFLKGTKENEWCMLFDVAGKVVLRQKTFDSQTTINTW